MIYIQHARKSKALAFVCISARAFKGSVLPSKIMVRGKNLINIIPIKTNNPTQSVPWIILMVDPAWVINVKKPSFSIAGTAKLEPQSPCHNGLSCVSMKIY
jgi:hypothetical protein